MTRKLFLIILAALFTHLVLGQSETYIVKKASFSSDRFDEFSPVYYKNGIVFCSNRYLGLSNRSTSQNKGLFKICYIDTTGKAGWESARLFSKNLTTILNDGPVTFNKTIDTIYFSRNQNLSGKLSDISGSRNKLGLYSAVLVGGQWTKVRELRINSEYYNITTPCLSPDGKKLYFASDKPEGFGGADLYYSEWKDGRWNDAVNLGSVINTSGNESYPFIDAAGELFFSSDGRKGNGGKDIYFSSCSDSTWSTPICLDPPINSKFDDFGITTDTIMDEGYISSNRDKSIDIYKFKTIIPQIFYSDVQKENQFCFKFKDTGDIEIDTLNLKYIWYFGDGKKAAGKSVNHCYPGPGNYNVKLDIVEKSTANLFFHMLDYNLQLRDYQQPYINSHYEALVGDEVEFDALRSYLPGFKILRYSWDFGDGTKSSGDKVRHQYKGKGEYNVNLGLTLKSIDSDILKRTGVTKMISIFDNQLEMNAARLKNSPGKGSVRDIGNYNNSLIHPNYSAGSETEKLSVFKIELLSSKNKIGLNSSLFRNLPNKYTLKETYIKDDSIYSYTVESQMSLMATYPSYKELYTLGFSHVKVREFVLSDPAEKELYNLIKIYNLSPDTYFDWNEMLNSTAFITLDQIVKLLNNYPSIKLEIDVHTDNAGISDNNLALSRKRSQMLVNYLINRGISKSRLIAKGFGDLKPIAPNSNEKGRKQNRRIEFVIINK